MVWNEETGEKADLIILIAVPLSEAGDTYMKILANLSRRLMHEEFRESLRTSTRDHVGMMARMLDFTNKMAGGSADVDPVHAQSVTFSLITAMSKRLDMPFDRDKTLLEGLLNHMIPLIQRVML